MVYELYRSAGEQEQGLRELVEIESRVAALEKSLGSSKVVVECFVNSNMHSS